jgi:hypothetical protein
MPIASMVIETKGHHRKEAGYRIAGQSKGTDLRPNAKERGVKRRRGLPGKSEFAGYRSEPYRLLRKR